MTGARKCFRCLRTLPAALEPDFWRPGFVRETMHLPNRVKSALAIASRRRELFICGECYFAASDALHAKAPAMSYLSEA